MRSPSSSAVDRAGTPAQVMLRNVGYNLAARVWFLILTLATTPVLVHGLGPQLFGLYALVGALAGYFAVLDLGLGVATVKFVSEYRGREDHEAITRTVGTAITAFLGLGAAAALVLTLGAAALVDRVLDVPPELRGVAITAVRITALGLMVTMPLAILNAIPTALQRMDITNRRNALFATATLVGSVALVLAGHGLIPILLYNVAVNAVAVVTFAVTTRRLLPGVHLRPRLDLASLRSLGGFGALKFANQIATQTVYHLDKFLLAALAPLAAVGHYVIALALAQRLGVLVSNVATAFLPAASQAHGRTDGEGFEELYVRGTKLVALFVFPIGMLLVVFAHPILLHWIGPDAARASSGVLAVVSVAYVVNALSTMPAVACDSRGRPGITTAFSVGSAALNVGLALLLIPPLGAMGAALAVLGNSVLLVPVFLVYVHRRMLRLSAAELVRRGLVRPAVATAVLLPAAWVLRGWAESLPTLVLALGAAVVLYVAVAIAVGACDATDRALFPLLGRASRRPGGP